MNRHQLHELGGGTPSGLLAQRAVWMPDSVSLLFKDEDTGKVRKAEPLVEGLASGTWDAVADGHRVPKP